MSNPNIKDDASRQRTRAEQDFEAAMLSNNDSIDIEEEDSYIIGNDKEAKLNDDHDDTFDSSAFANELTAIFAVTVKQIVAQISKTKIEKTSFSLSPNNNHNNLNKSFSSNNERKPFIPREIVQRRQRNYSIAPPPVLTSGKKKKSMFAVLHSFDGDAIDVKSNVNDTNVDENVDENELLVKSDSKNVDAPSSFSNVKNISNPPSINDLENQNQSPSQRNRRVTAVVARSGFFSSPKISQSQSNQNQNQSKSSSSRYSSSRHNQTYKNKDPDATIMLINKAPFVLISHDSELKQFWDTLVMTCVMYQTIQAPYELAYQKKFVFNVDYIDNFMICIFLVDFAQNFFTTYTDPEDESLVINWKKICKNYHFSVWFWVDFISCIPYELLNSNATTWLKTFKLFRLFRVGKLFKNAETLSKAGAVRLVRLLLVVVVLFHWCSCGWWAAGKMWFCYRFHFNLGFMIESLDIGTVMRIFKTDDVNFLVSNPPSTLSLSYLGFEEEELVCEAFVVKVMEGNLVYRGEPLEFQTLQVYTASLSQAASNIMGGSSAFTVAENCYSSCITVIGAVLQATVFGSVAVLLASFDEDEVQYKKKIQKINKRMTTLKVDPVLQEKVRLFYSKLWQTDRSISTNSDDFIKEVSRPLADDIRMGLYDKLLSKVTFLQGVDEFVIEALVNQLSTKLYLENDFVIRKGEQGDFLGILGTGKVNILHPETNAILRTMVPGDYLGEMSLLYSVQRTVDVQAITWVVMHVLTKADLDLVKLSWESEITYIEDFLQETLVQKQYTVTNAKTRKTSNTSNQTKNEKSGGGGGSGGDDKETKKKSKGRSITELKTIMTLREGALKVIQMKEGDNLMKPKLMERFG